MCEPKSSKTLKMSMWRRHFCLSRYCIGPKGITLLLERIEGKTPKRVAKVAEDKESGHAEIHEFFEEQNKVP